MNREYFAEGLPNLDDPNHAISFDADTIAQALVNIYQKKYGNGKEIEPTLFEKTKEIFEGAISKGVKQSSFSIDTAFKHQLTHNMWVFSAFRTHKMQRDIAKYLLNEKGELKTFTKFVKDVAPYIKHTNRLWLETEYNTAVLRAHQAADWRKFVDERDVLPNLEWQPSTSTNPGEDHKPYWFTCLPIDHKFWKQHRPGDRWNCKCSLRNTDKEPTPVPADTIIKGSEPQRGLESNPGEKGEIFSNNHPYYPENCGKCPFNKGVGKLWAALVGTKKHCNNSCNFFQKELKKALEKAEIRKKQENIKTTRYNIIHSITEATFKNELLTLNNIETGLLYNCRKSTKTLLSHSYNEAEIEVAMSVVKHLDKLEYVRHSYLGEGKNPKDSNDKTNIKKKIEKGVIYYNIYFYEYKGRRWVIKTEVYYNRQEKLYSFTKKP